MRQMSFGCWCMMMVEPGLLGASNHTSRSAGRPDRQWMSAMTYCPSYVSPSMRNPLSLRSLLRAPSAATTHRARSRREPNAVSTVNRTCSASCSTPDTSAAQCNVTSGLEVSASTMTCSSSDCETLTIGPRTSEVLCGISNRSTSRSR